MTSPGRVLFFFCAAGFMAPVVRAAFDDEPVFQATAPWPDAGELVGGVVAALPDVPVVVNAQLQSRDRKGSIERAVNVEMRLDWYGQPPSASYQIRDAFGEDQEKLCITWPEPGRRAYQYLRGSQPARTPSLDSLIEGTDISWMDLSLSFLWWPGGRTVGMERIKGRQCYVVELPAPSDEPVGYAGVRLWIDPRIHMMLQAAAYDREGEMQRLVEVKSFKKVKDLWVIQDLDVQSFPGRHRTSLRVRQVALANEPDAAAEASPESEPDE